MDVLQQNLLVLLSPLGACVIISNDDSDEVEDVYGESILKQSRKGTLGESKLIISDTNFTEDTRYSAQHGQTEKDEQP
jgi:hypothetical protein